MSTTGQRAAAEIRKRAYPDKPGKELEALEISQDSYCKWKQGKVNPDACALGKMAAAGYDVHYILTGKNDGETARVVRCGSCGNREENARGGTVWCRRLGLYMPENGYCSYGRG